MINFRTVVKFKRADGFYSVYIRVTKDRKIAYIRTDKIVNDKGIGKNKDVIDPVVLQFTTNQISNYIEILNRENTELWTVQEVVDFIQKANKDLCFSEYARHYIDNLYNEGHERNSKNYSLALQHLERFAGTNKLMFSRLTSNFINLWIKTLSNTSRAKEMYPVCMRQVFRQALIDFNDYDTGKLIIKTNPWLNVKIPKADTPEKRAITMQDCRAFFAAPLPESDRLLPLSELGRDVAMMTICLAGINTADIYNLEKAKYKDGIIAYNRAKTKNARADKAYFEIRVPTVLQPIVDKYLDESDSPYLFNFHYRMRTFDSFTANVNVGIKQICEKSLNILHEQTYSIYTFRHTWATVAQNECGASLSEVDFALNHAHGSRLARTYVKIDFSPAWELNEKVVEKIFFTEELSNQHSQKQKGDCFERFSFKQLIKGTLYHQGKIIAKVEDTGFNNVEEVIKKLWQSLPPTIPKRSMVQIRIENKDKGQTKDYTRMVK